MPKHLSKIGGGFLEIQSALDCGTTISLKLPKREPPSWFVSLLEVYSPSHVVILDDDYAIHQIWRGRFEIFKNDNINLLHFSTPEELKNWILNNSKKLEDFGTIFLIDYELIGYEETGLSLIESLKIAEFSILTTSRNDELFILQSCQRIGVKMIPKGMVGFVPIKIIKVQEKLDCISLNDDLIKSGYKNSDIRNHDLIFIDDDTAITHAWVLYAIANDKKISVYNTIHAFKVDLDQYALNTPLYIDSDLNDVMSGQDFAKEFYEKGFRNIYLATGHRGTDFQKMDWIKGVVGKMPPF